MNLRRSFLTIFFVMLALPVIASAQVLYGQLTGNVTDSNKAVVAGAVVSITHRETGQSREATTDANGTYDFPTRAGRNLYGQSQQIRFQDRDQREHRGDAQHCHARRHRRSTSGR